jgi:hypothetical protein
MSEGERDLLLSSFSFFLSDYTSFHHFFAIALHAVQIPRAASVLQHMHCLSLLHFRRLLALIPGAYFTTAFDFLALLL